MCSSIGPNSYTPGQTLPFKVDGRVCDHGNCDQTARHCVVGETDSFGSELQYLCDHHFLDLKAALEEKKKELQLCDICKNLSRDCTQVRDPEEGMSGRLYTVCPDCRRQLLHIDPEDLDEEDVPSDTDDDLSDYEPFDDREDDDE